MLKTPSDVLTFWLVENGPEQWYKGGDAFDAAIRERFEPTWQAAIANQLQGWSATPEACLAYVILTDQFPRNMFRGEARSFGSDRLAIMAAKKVIERGWDLRIDEPERHFFYMPLMHSESLVDQDRCIRLILTRLPKAESSQLLHAKAHREVIRDFGRFPYRNDALGRAFREDERAYLERGGYGFTVNSLQAAA